MAIQAFGPRETLVIFAHVFFIENSGFSKERHPWDRKDIELLEYILEQEEFVQLE
jgi:hypothetical protein